MMRDGEFQASERKRMRAADVTANHRARVASPEIEQDASLLGNGAAVLDETASAVLRAQTVEIGWKVMICAAVFQLFDAVGIVYSGALRGAGDTRWPMVALVILSWSLVVGGGYTMAFALPAHQYMPMMMR